MNSKKFLAFAMAAAMTLSMTACGGSGSGAASSGTDSTAGTAFKLGGTGPLTGDAAIYGLAAQLEGGAGVLLDGAGVGRVGGLGCPAAVTAAAAAGQQGHAESTRQCKRQEASLFHSGILL